MIFEHWNRFKKAVDSGHSSSEQSVGRIQSFCFNAVCPGYIDTPMMDRFTGGTPEGRAKVIAEEPVGRMGKPEEIAAAVIWLCSDAAAFVVGHAMVMDGGQTI